MAGNEVAPREAGLIASPPKNKIAHTTFVVSPITTVFA
jgi:hypothetical protein